MVRKGATAMIETFTNSEKETCKTAEGLLEILGKKFRPQHKETIPSLQVCKLKRKSVEYAPEWMGRL